VSSKSDIGEEYTIELFNLKPVRNSGRGTVKGDSMGIFGSDRVRFDTKTTKKKSYASKKYQFNNMLQEGLDCNTDLAFFHIVFYNDSTDIVEDEQVIMPISSFKHLIDKAYGSS
jgi:hypothetical protein